jgi:hypothetical protein
LIFVSIVVQHLAPGDAPCIDMSLSPFSAARSACFFVQAQRRKKDITGQATIIGIRASTRSSKENDGRGSCCNLIDCRPTQSRMVGDHYEVKVDGQWMSVPYDKINNVVAPDGGAHVCAPRQVGPNKGVLFCVILPSEG